MRALVLIDLQVGILDGPPAVVGREALLENVRVLLRRARHDRAPILFVKHDGPTGHRAEVGSDGWRIDPSVAPAMGEAVVHKRECDAFLRTELERTIRGTGATELVIAGCMTQYCIDTTVRRAFSLGFDVTLASDAHGTADTAELTAAQIVAHHNATLDGFGCSGQVRGVRVVPTNEVSFEPPKHREVEPAPKTSRATAKRAAR